MQTTTMIITISGTPGSGKSTVAKSLATKLKYKHYSGGDLRGKLAIELGITIDELNKLGEKDPSTDKKADEYIAKLGKQEDNFVIDSRLAWHFIPKSLKVFLTVDMKTAAERIFSDAKKKHRLDEPLYKTPADVEKAIMIRMKSDSLRYKKWYKLNYLDIKNYDLVIDTTNETVDSIVKNILSNL